MFENYYQWKYFLINYERDNIAPNAGTHGLIVLIDTYKKIYNNNTNNIYKNNEFIKNLEYYNEIMNKNLNNSNYIYQDKDEYILLKGKETLYKDAPLFYKMYFKLSEYLGFNK